MEDSTKRWTTSMNKVMNDNSIWASLERSNLDNTAKADLEEFKTKWQSAENALDRMLKAKKDSDQTNYDKAANEATKARNALEAVRIRLEQSIGGSEIFKNIGQGFQSMIKSVIPSITSIIGG